MVGRYIKFLVPKILKIKLFEISTQLDMHNRLTTSVNNGTGCAWHTDFAMDLFSFTVHELLLARLRCYESSVLTQASLDTESSDAVSTV